MCASVSVCVRVMGYPPSSQHCDNEEGNALHLSHGGIERVKESEIERKKKRKGDREIDREEERSPAGG